MDILKSIEHEQLKNKIPELRVGNTGILFFNCSCSIDFKK